MKVSGPILADRQALLDRAAASGLFTSSQRTKAEGVLPPDASTASRAAQHLVHAGMLTRFQAERLLAGRTDGFVLGQYVIEDGVGRGPAGRVYRARHRTMNRHVALKVLSPELTRQSAARQIFHDGVRAAAKLNHPNIVTTYDANEVGERFYVVLEYVDGPSVQALVEQRGPLPWNEACEIVRQAAAGLQHAHEQGMTHRNLTPGNVLLTRNAKGAGGQVKITDFGLAALSPAARGATLEQTPLPPAFAANLRYVAPDRSSCYPADPRVDLYSLGGIFYLLLTGRPPSGDGNVELPPHIPPAIAHVVQSLLAREAAHRIASAAELIELLINFSHRVVPVHEDHTAVNFEVHGGARTDSMTGGYLAGIPEPEPSPWADIVTPIYESGPDTLGSIDPKGCTPFSLPALAVQDQPTARSRPTKAPPTKSSTIPVLVVIAVSMCILSLCAIAAVLKYADK